MYKQLTIEQIKVIVNNCEEHTVRQIARMISIDPTIVYYFLLHIGINKPFGGEDFMKVERDRKKIITPKKKKQIEPEQDSKAIVRPKSEYSNLGHFNLMKLAEED
jgi:hypothetical protein